MKLVDIMECAFHVCAIQNVILTNIAMKDDARTVRINIVLHLMKYRIAKHVIRWNALKDWNVIANLLNAGPLMIPNVNQNVGRARHAPKDFA